MHRRFNRCGRAHGEVLRLEQGSEYVDLPRIEYPLEFAGPAAGMIGLVVNLKDAEVGEEHKPVRMPRPPARPARLLEERSIGADAHRRASVVAA